MSQHEKQASEEEVLESAEEAKAHFGGTHASGDGAESAADDAIAQGRKPGPFQDDEAIQEQAEAQNTAGSSGDESLSKDEAVTNSQGDGEPTTGQKFANILASDPNMKWESKVAEKLSGDSDDDS